MLKSHMEWLSVCADLTVMVERQSKRISPETFVDAFSDSRKGDMEELFELLYTLGFIDRSRISELSLAKWK